MFREISRLVAVGVFGLAAWMILARANLVPPGAEAKAVRWWTWFYAVYFTWDVLINAFSKTRRYRYFEAPVAAVLAICFLLVARS